MLVAMGWRRCFEHVGRRRVTKWSSELRRRRAGAAACYGRQWDGGNGERKATGLGGLDAGSHSESDKVDGVLGEAETATKWRWRSRAAGDEDDNVDDVAGLPGLRAYAWSFRATWRSRWTWRWAAPPKRAVATPRGRAARGESSAAVLRPAADEVNAQENRLKQSGAA